MRALIPIASAALLFLTGCDEDPTKASSTAGVNVIELRAYPPCVDVSGTTRLTCVASGGHQLSYAWDAEAGSLLPDGASVTWSAPSAPGVYTLSVNIFDQNGNQASEDIDIEVFGKFRRTSPCARAFAGSLLVPTNQGLVAISGNAAVDFIPNALVDDFEVLGRRIFLHVRAPRSIREITASGETVHTIPIPDQVNKAASIVALPDGGFAVLDQLADELVLIDPDGNFLSRIPFPEQTPTRLQTARGIVVDRELIISETGNGKLMKVDLETRIATIWRDFGTLGILSDIAHDEQSFYLANRSSFVHSFAPGSEPVQVGALPGGEYNITGVVVVGDDLYLSVNFSGKVYRINLSDGLVEVFASGLGYPQEIEYLP